jgi:hypothetical protein
VLSIHFDAFQTQRNIINDFLSGEVPLPAFARPACSNPSAGSGSLPPRPLLLPPMEKVNTDNDCKWRNMQQQVNDGNANKATGFLNVFAVVSKDTITNHQLRQQQSLSVGAGTQTSAQGSNHIITTTQVMPNNSLTHYWQVFGGLDTQGKQSPSSSAPVQIQSYINVADISVHDDIEKTWRGSKCILDHSSARNGTVKNDVAAINTALFEAGKSTDTSLTRYVIGGLCGRGGNKNTIDDLAISVTHLLVLYRAVQYYRLHNPSGKASVSNRFSQKGRFAFIIEEDVQFAFDIDFRALIESAPTNFAMLQLTNTDHKLLWARHRKYHDQQSQQAVKEQIRTVDMTNRMWDKRDTLIESWATSAYLVDVAAIAPIIDKMVTTSIGEGGIIQVNLKAIAGIGRPCMPRECCVSTAQGVIFDQNNKVLPCVLSPRGFISDAFVPAMLDPAGMYSTNLPLVVNGLNGRLVNKYNQKYRMDKESARGLQTQRKFVNNMYEAEKSSIPSFITPACLFGVETAVLE